MMMTEKECFEAVNEMFHEGNAQIIGIDWTVTGIDKTITVAIVGGQLHEFGTWAEAYNFAIGLKKQYDD